MMYFELNYASTDNREQQELLAQTWHLLHAVASNKDVAFRVSFPFWKDPVKSEKGAILRVGVFGPVMRVFADEAGLRVLHEELLAHRLIRSGLVTATGLRQAPAGATWVVFARSRSADRVTDGYVRREQRRADKRASQGDMRGKPLNRGLLMERHAQTRSNFVSLRSADNGHRYSLNVARRGLETSESLPDQPSSFGLGAAVPEF